MEASPTITILEESHICPPSSSPPFSSSLHLTFFDIPWLLHPPSQPLFFYHFTTTSTSPSHHFTSTILPKLKHSLSLTLLHFFPFSGKLAASSHSNPALPTLAYSDGDSVRLTVAEAASFTKAEFNHLCSSNSTALKDAHVLRQLVPTCSQVLSDLLAVQITCFPQARGFSIGLAYPHVVCDQRTFNHFLKAWASLCKFGLANGLEPKPNYDRSSIMDRDGLVPILAAQWWERGGFVTPTKHKFSISGGRVRATFVMSPLDIENGRNWIEAQCRKKNKVRPVLLSPYVVACAVLWSSMGKAHNGPAHKGPVYFGFIAGGLTRLSYRVPVNYFGNCVAFGHAAVGSAEELVGEGGVVAAAAAIGEAVKRLDRDVLGGAERWIAEWETVVGTSEMNVSVVGSPKVDLYGRDFGWGRARKVEEVGIDGLRSGVSLCDSRDFKGGIEIGVSLSKPKMEAFGNFFKKGIHEFSMGLID